jgi:hypothetical protein
MKKESQIHKGFSAEGEDEFDNGFNAIEESTAEAYFEKAELDELGTEEESAVVAEIKDCTILWWNGQYQKPNITISDGKFRFVSKHRNVTKIQLRSVGGGIRYYTSLGTHRIPNGSYVLSLWGSTYGYNNISACVKYNV